MISRRDSDLSKGALEPETRQQCGNASLHAQLDHRSRNPLIKEYDSDFPEPGSNPEHSGERTARQSNL